MTFFGRMRRLVTGQHHIERVSKLEEKVVKFGRSHREQLAAQDERLRALGHTVGERASTTSVRALGRRVEDLQTALVQLDRTIADALERARVQDQLANEDRRVARRIESMIRAGHPIVVGPWTGEVGFELLYWIPFVRWVVQTYDVPLERLFVVSRGGVAGWYAGLGGSYADVFSYFSTDEFRVATEERKKQRRERAFDAAVIERVIASHKLGRASLLHPGMMYRLLMPFWKEEAPVSRADRYAVHARIAPGDDGVLQRLPANYAAARFYFSDCFPDTPANRTLVTSVLEMIGRDRPVVLLNTPFALDDHRDAVASGAHVITLDANAMSPERNLAVQTAVIGRASLFAGTYGGYSYLAPLCGVPSLAFYSRRSFQDAHLDVAQRVFERLGSAPIVPVAADQLPLLRAALGGATATT